MKKAVLSVLLLLSVWVSVLTLSALDRKDLVIDQPYLRVTDPQWSVSSRWAKVEAWNLTLVMVAAGYLATEDRGILYLAQQQDPQPDPDDPHAGQPDMCTNAKNATAAHKCDCSKAPEEEGGAGCDVEDKKCRVYCRAEHCHCFHGKCDS